jgi:hypothetical protein
MAAAQSGKLPVPDDFRARYPDWFDQFAVIFVGGITAIFLEQVFGEQEAASFILMEHKSRGFKVLPNTVKVLQHYLEERQNGRFTEVADFLPAFRHSLSVAEKFSRL